jgi:hemolysin activation/secretion protein
MGDTLDISYSHTKGSDSFDTSYTFPINAYNGTLRAAMGRTKSDVIEGNFNILGIRANSKYYEFSIRQPIKQTASEELALGLTFSRQESQTFLSLDGFSGPFKLSPGADERGQTKISAFRLFQEWNKRTSRQVLAGRSQFSIGSTILNANESEEQPGIAKEPDSRFLSWRGQGQWVRLLAPDTLLLVKGDLQLADRALVPLEQFSAGGQQTVRGYRQDVLLSDNGLSFSTEVRIPVWRVPKVNGLLQVAPFIDMARGWNTGKTAIENQTLVGAGIGLLWRQNSLSARLDWGIPLINQAKNKETLQEKGVYFSINYSPF